MDRGGADRAASLARSRSGRLGRGLRGGGRNMNGSRSSGGGVGARATLDLGALATNLGTPQDPQHPSQRSSNTAAAAGSNASGGGLAARIRALFGGAPTGQDSERRGLGAARSRKERTNNRNTRPEVREHAQVDGRRFVAVPNDVDAAPGGAGTKNAVGPMEDGGTSNSHHNNNTITALHDNDWNSSRQSGRLRRGAGGSKPTAASSLGSLQSYAQSTVKDSGPLPGCFRTSTSEVELVRRFERRTGNSSGSTHAGDGGAGASDEQLVFSDQVRKNGLLSRRPDAFEYPHFALSEYGSPSSWNSDVFVLVHNAIRWEIMDLYTIIGSIQRRWLGLTMLDIYEFSEYWEVFELFIAQTFEIEDQIIFPYLLNIAASSEDLARYYKSVKYSKEKLVGMLYDIGSTIEMFNSDPPGEVLPALYQQVVDYLPKLLDYMEKQDNVLPPIFSSYCDPEDRIMLNRAVANFLIRAANGRHGIAILTRWIEDSMILQIWKDENLSARAKSSHKKWLNRLDEQHVEIARRFQRRLRSGKPSMQLNDETDMESAQLPDRRDPRSVPHLTYVAV